MDFITKFQKIKTKFEKADLKKLKEDFAIQVNLVDEDCGGAFYVSNINNVFSVEPYDYNDYTAMLTSDAAAFERLIGRRADFEKALKANKISVEGNAEHVAAMIELFPKPERKPCVKKAVEKKETPKKSPKKK